MKFYDFMEAVVPIIKKPWHEDGNDNLLLNRAGKKQYAQNRLNKFIFRYPWNVKTWKPRKRFKLYITDVGLIFFFAFLPFSVWCPLKGQTYINKSATFSLKVQVCLSICDLLADIRH